MSAILSADDLNDFISPGVACIKPIETLPKQQPEDNTNPYEVTTEEKVSASEPPPASISLADCLACSGCVTSAEAVLVSLQSHSEVLETLNKYREIRLLNSYDETLEEVPSDSDAKVFVASISPQTRASLAVTYNVSEREAGNMIAQLLSGPLGVRAGGQYNSGFSWIVDTKVMRELCLVAAADEVQQVLESPVEQRKKPILTSACPGWICYAEKTHPHILPHLSELKSPQALCGTLVKSVLAKRFGVSPDKIWHLAVMPCFDKKLEASRSELTSDTWYGQDHGTVRDVDCVITARELLMLAESRGISFPQLPKNRLSRQYAPDFPDRTINSFLFGTRKRSRRNDDLETAAVGTSGGYLWHVLKSQQAQRPGSEIRMQKGRNNDVAEYFVVDSDGRISFRAARYYGFRNILNLVRRLKPARASRVTGAVRKPGGSARSGASAADSGEYSYVEVMACPGGCTNGGGQIKVGDVATLRQVGGTGIVNGSMEQDVLPAQREWLAKVDEAYWSAEFEEEESEDVKGAVLSQDSSDDLNFRRINGIDTGYMEDVLKHWSHITGVGISQLIHTTYRVVESNVGKGSGTGTDMEKVSALAIAQGGGW